NKQLVVLVHGWSVRTTETYGGLPQRLKREAKAQGLAIDVRNIWLSKYISFHNEVRLEDISRAFEAALQHELGEQLKAGQRLSIISHSTGGPVVRDWLQRYYLRPGRKTTPLNHLIMLAPANFGSALAQLGKTRISRLKAWFEGVEPGLGVLDWLELGSPESWALNCEWMDQGDDLLSTRGVWPFVLTGQTIDRHFYDHVNSYTGEVGSDGVVRSASANLNFSYVRLQQQLPDGRSTPDYLPLHSKKAQQAPETAFALVPGRAHSGDDIGIMRSVPANTGQHPTVDAIVACLKVNDKRSYHSLKEAFAAQTAAVQAQELVEEIDLPGPYNRMEFRDPCSQLMFRVRDDTGLLIRDFDLIFTAGKQNSADRLPPKFFIDRQKNHRDAGTLTYYLNYSRMMGAPAVVRDGEELRPALPGSDGFGLRIVPYPLDGFVHYIPAVLHVTKANLQKFIKPNATTLVDIVLHRVLHRGVYRLAKNGGKDDFTQQPTGKIVGRE
ncbi:MAG TPA: alpha/beta hydrolase, partial [Gammaproteobacteria bacterium]|nr:alpha/beta hydrolase [Gammaproteobacteria bacterium]